MEIYNLFHTFPNLRPKVKKNLENQVNLEKIDHRKYLVVKNARQNNLKNIDLAISQNKFVIITGVSGSGKSSLAFDTLYAEGQRRYIESLSAYVRQFLGKIDKPEVDYIKGLAPAVAIRQKVNTSNPRSTVGTSTEVYDYLKLLFARAGKTYSPLTGEEVKRHKVEDVVRFMKKQREGTKAQILAPVIKPDERSWKEEFSVILQKGFPRVLVGDKAVKVEEVLGSYNHKGSDPGGLVDLIESRKKKMSGIFILVDRVKNRKKDPENKSRLADSVQTAFFEGHGECVLEVFQKKNRGDKKWFSNRFEENGIPYEEPSVNLFTFNSPYGACPVCEGFSQSIDIDEDKVIPDRSLSVYDGAVACWRGQKMSRWKIYFISRSQRYGFPIHRPYNKLKEKEKELLWEGRGEVKGLRDFFRYLGKKTYKIQYRVLLARYKGKTICPECKGGRLRKEAEYVKVGGRSITELVKLPVSKLQEFLENLELPKTEMQIAGRILTEIRTRTELLNEVGLGYLSLNRPSNTLSGGESQRIQLVTSLGSNLTGSLYILDEPTVGLHPRDNNRLVRVLKNLKRLGNTVIVVEHEEEVIRAADEIIDLGPGAGRNGGKVVFQGTLEELKKARECLTSRYLSGDLQIPVPEFRRNAKFYINILHAHKHNLKNVDVQIPLNAFSVITGVSGSGKSTLVKEVIYPSLRGSGGLVRPESRHCREVSGDIHRLKHIEFVDQNPLGRSTRSNPVTYLKAFDPIRELFASVPVARANSLKPAQFSFNVEGGRCEECKGEGYIEVEMQFMANIRLTCEKCRGKRFKETILQIKYKDKSIADVLDMTVNEAIEFFEDRKPIVNTLKPLVDVGLGYLKLGQPSNNLSGGEAQRIKLASFLAKGQKQEPVLFIFDEPTTGLHFHDINHLLKAFNALVAKGHTVLVVEHNLEIVKSADWMIDLGKEGGEEGGYVLYQGPPEGILEKKNSYTQKYLKKKMLNF